MHQAGIESVFVKHVMRFTLDIRSTDASVAAPKAYRKGRHEEGVGTEIRRHCKVGIKKGSSTCLLKLGQIGSFPSDKR
jgi:hypothetical protein